MLEQNRIAAASRIKERHARDQAHIQARAGAQDQPVQRPVDDPDAGEVAGSQNEVGVLLPCLLEEAGDVRRVV